jgi:hypothetical protein
LVGWGKVLSSSASIESGDQMSRKETERAEKAERDRAEKVRKEKDKDDRKLRDKAEKDRKDKAKSDKKLQDKAEKDRKDKDKSNRKIQVDERARKFEDVLGAAAEGCCESCNYQVRTSNGEYQPCKMGHKDSGSDKEFCVDSSNPHYCPKK